MLPPKKPDRDAQPPPGRAGPEYSQALNPVPAPWYRRAIAVRPGNRADRDPLVRWRAPWPSSPTSNASSNGSSSAPPRACSAPTSSRCSSSGASSARWSAPDRGAAVGRVVPGRYRVRVQPDDLHEVAEQAGGAEALAGRLADAALDVRPGPRLPPAVGRPGVALVADPSVARGRGRGRRRGGVRAPRRREPPEPAPSQPAGEPSPSASQGAPAAAAAASAASVASAAVPQAWTPIRSSTRSSPIARSGTRRPRPSSRRHTRACAATGRRRSSSAGPRRPRPAPCSACGRPDGTERTIEVDGTPLDDRAVARQRARPRRHRRLAPARPAPGPSRDARLHRPRQHERLARQRRSGSTRSRSARATASCSATRCSSSNRCRADGRVDGFVLTLWIVRLLFLLAAVRRSCSRSCGCCCVTSGAASREPGGARPADRGRVARAASRRRAVVPARRGDDARSRRQQLDRRRRPVRVQRARRAHVPRPRLVRRGPREHQRHVRQRRAASSGVAPLGFGDEIQVGEVRFRLDRAAR